MSRSKAIQYYIAARLLLAPLMVWTIVTLVFLLLRATPGDPADAILGNRAPEALRESLGLNKPLWLQYLAYLGQLLSLNLGTSVTSQGQSVWEIITQHFPATAELTFYSMVVAMAIGVTIGILSASRPNTAIDVGGATVWHHHLFFAHILGGNALSVNFCGTVALVSSRNPFSHQSNPSQWPDWYLYP